jgi:membrane-bound lytic murein transglycosylase B
MTRPRFRSTLFTALLLALAPAAPLAAQTGESGFGGYLQLLGARARGEGVSEATIARVLPGLTYNPKVIALDRAQPGNQNTPPPFAPYRAQHVDGNRIGGGRAVYRQVSGLLPGIEARYGVPGPVVLAIWGHETNYGSYTGDFDLARSLATLAYEGRRRELFASEFVALLKMIDQGVPRDRLYGSWAGAFGNPQFLPSVYLSTAVDGDGDGDRDIWTSRADTLASIANYFQAAGWRRGEPWGVRAGVPAGFDWASVRPRLVSPTCGPVHARHSAWKNVREWRQLGVAALGNVSDNTQAALFQPDGPGTPAWLLTGNYRVILQYNCSNYYALSVGLLADEIAN